jgi:hypothetical protein
MPVPSEKQGCADRAGDRPARRQKQGRGRLLALRERQPGSPLKSRAGATAALGSPVRASPGSCRPDHPRRPRLERSIHPRPRSFAVPHRTIAVGACALTASRSALSDTVKVQRHALVGSRGSLMDTGGVGNGRPQGEPPSQPTLVGCVSLAVSPDPPSAGDLASASDGWQDYRPALRRYCTPRSPR